ncbi:MAG: cobalt-precorrin-7 (C(5))-methyltransferase, partial [Huintestinicola sp.]
MSKKVIIAGIGMDGDATIIREAYDAVMGADILIGAKRMTECFSSLDKPVFVSCDSKETAEFIRSCEHERITVLMSGDCGFYSGAKKLSEELSDVEHRIIAGISSPAYFCSKLKRPWQDMKLVSLHGVDNSIAINTAS